MPSLNPRKRKFPEILPEMTRDIRNVHRGQCQACGDCEAFISVSGRVLCDYCGCPPAQHENLARENKKSRSSSSNSTSKTAESSPTDLSEVASLEISELEDDEVETKLKIRRHVKIPKEKKLKKKKKNNKIKKIALKH